MAGSKPFTLIAAILFGLMAAAHFYRSISGFPIVVAGHEVSQAVSWVALVITAVLSGGLFREARR